MNSKQTQAGHHLSIEELKRRIASLSAQFNSSENQLLALIHEFDGGPVPSLSYRAQVIIDEVVGCNHGDDTDNEIKNLSKVVNIPSAEG